MQTCISLFIQNADGTLTSKDYDGFLSDIMSNETIQPGEKNVGLAAEKRRIIAAADLAIHRDGYTPRFRAWTSSVFVEGQLSNSPVRINWRHHGISRVSAKPIIIDLNVFKQLPSYYSAG